MTDWIKCSERMPEIGERVLLTQNRAISDDPETTVGELSKDGCEWIYSQDYQLDSVQTCWPNCEPPTYYFTHWMPLPAPPEVQ
jgi:hypothetical protein